MTKGREEAIVKLQAGDNLTLKNLKGQWIVQQVDWKTRHVTVSSEKRTITVPFAAVKV